MYIRSPHAELRVPVLHQFLRDNSLGILTTALTSSKYPLLQSTHVPWVLDVPENPAESDLGVLRGHIARANPQAKAMIDATESDSKLRDGQPGQLSEEVLILFNGPADHYVTPKFYTETKPSTGKVVPTWNYSAVQVYGTATVYFDTASEHTKQFLSKQIVDLSQQAEVDIMGYTGVNGASEPWLVSDAPPKYIDLLQKAIIGIEVKITRIEGKFKMSQEMPEGDREGVVNGFRSLSTDAAQEVARTVKERGEMKNV